jgi:phage terminase small subunit
MGPLQNLRHERFCREYASGESIPSAYVRAGFKDSPNARFNGSRLRNTKACRERIDELMQQFAEQSAIKVEYLQHALLPLLRVNSQDLFDASGNLKPIGELQRDCAAATKSIKFDKKTGEVSEVVLTDKVAAAGMLLRSIGGLVDKVEVSESVEQMTDEQTYIAALEAAVKLLGALGLPRETLNQLNHMIEECRTDGIEEFQTDALDQALVPPVSHGKRPQHDRRGR